MAENREEQPADRSTAVRGELRNENAPASSSSVWLVQRPEDIGHEGWGKLRLCLHVRSAAMDILEPRTSTDLERVEILMRAAFVPFR
jgi:hypothetical protein